MAEVPMIPTASALSSPAAYVPLQDDRPEMKVIYGSLFDNEQLDGVWRGCEVGIRLLAVTNRRLIMVENTSFEDRLALTSVPLSRVTSCSYLASSSADRWVGETTAVGIRVLGMHYEVVCRTEDEARELHDLIAWNLVLGAH
jgi:hypothetical protein